MNEDTICETKKGKVLRIKPESLFDSSFDQTTASLKIKLSIFSLFSEISYSPNFLTNGLPIMLGAIS